MSRGFLTPPTRSAGGEGVLQRVTIVASRPDDTLIYLRADYSSPADVQARTVGSGSAQVSKASTSRAVATQTGLPAYDSSRSGSPYNSGRGIELYASTQRLPAETPVTHIDVHA
jgi:hypothetical protein